MLNEYHFITYWRVQGSAEDAYDLIHDPAGYARWWPAVYLGVEDLDVGGESGLGRRVRFHTKGWLPYTLLWESCAIRAERPHMLIIRATGDFDGRGIWQFHQLGEFVEVVFDWKLTADKPLLKHASPLLKPVFEANHRWAMAQGERSLALELRRRRAKSEDELKCIPAPPGPNTTSGLVLAAAGIGVVAALLALSRRKRE